MPVTPAVSSYNPEEQARIPDESEPAAANLPTAKVNPNRDLHGSKREPSERQSEIQWQPPNNSAEGQRLRLIHGRRFHPFHSSIIFTKSLNR
jgi:hypothetical protein